MNRLVSIAAMILALALAPGCAYLVSPPTRPEEPVSVFIADLGYHASILLPREPAATAEYAYGHYEWFALNKDDLWRAPGVVLLPGRGTLGRRTLGVPCTRAALETVVYAEELLELRVDRSRAESLRRALDGRFDGAGPPVFNAVMGMDFVPDSRRYWIAHNCNAALVDWLRDLGCTVRGGSLDANFRIVGPR
ncbi:MAG: hypothetical protein AB7K52_13835 [Phycisphaerales bacterium]